jgi:hypothetical protein
MPTIASPVAIGKRDGHVALRFNGLLIAGLAERHTTSRGIGVRNVAAVSTTCARASAGATRLLNCHGSDGTLQRSPG